MYAAPIVRQTSQPLPATRKTRKRGAEQLEYVKRCLEAVEGYEGLIAELAQRSGLQLQTLNQSYWVLRLGDKKLLDDLRAGRICLAPAYALAKHLIAPRGASAKARWARATPEQRAAHSAKVSVGNRAHWDNITPARRAAHGAKVWATRRAIATAKTT